jgi:hypothetical protein
LGREERTKVEARSDEGEGGGARTDPIRIAGPGTSLSAGICPYAGKKKA